MIEYANDPSLYLYHYTSSDTARKILESGSVRLAPYQNTNDPKESKDWHFSVGMSVNGRNLDHATAQSMSDWLSSTIKSTARLACFCTDSPPPDRKSFK
jgi:transcriptional regulator GlxA family with amidase domain